MGIALAHWRWQNNMIERGIAMTQTKDIRPLLVEIAIDPSTSKIY